MFSRHHAGSRQQRNFQGMQIAGKTLAVMGFGEVGFEMARRAKGLGMQVIAYDPYASPYRARSIGIELVGFDKALMSADVISLHMHLTPTTRNMLRDETFAKMKEGVQILNVAHRELIDGEALLRALDAGIVARVCYSFSTKTVKKSFPFKQDSISGNWWDPRFLRILHAFMELPVTLSFSLKPEKS